jgi:hypothetical protein
MSQCETGYLDYPRLTGRQLVLIFRRSDLAGQWVCPYVVL